jgi:flavin-dependent dehydrogenase
MSAAPAIEIVGGGLAGLSLGLALQRAGTAVTLCEAGRYPRHRVCGEFITGLDETTIEGLGLAPLLADALRHREVAWHIDGQLARVQHLPSPALGISRYALDARLADAFVAAGGELRCDERIVDLAPKPGRILAIGRRRGKPTWIGLKIHVHGLSLTRDLELHLGREAYVGLSRVEDGAVNVCGLFRQRKVAALNSDDATNRVETLFAYLRAVKLSGLADRLAAATIEAESFSAVAALEFGGFPAQTDTIAIGDACAMIPPFTGNGMAMAFQSAVLAAGPVARYSRGEIQWDRACRECAVALRHRFRLRLASADALHPFLLRRTGQRVLAALTRARLVPLRPLYAVMH